MDMSQWLPLITLVIVGIVVFAIVQLLTGGSDADKDRLRQQLKDGARESAAPRMGRLARETLPQLAKPLLPDKEEERTELKSRFYQAGLYSPYAIHIYLSVKLGLIVLPIAIGALLGSVGLIDMQQGLLFGSVLGVLGILGPSRYLDARAKKRQRALKKGLPDALDLVVICLEAGLTVEAGFRRVTLDLRFVHPELAFELLLVQRDTEIGRTAGQGLKNLADRCQLHELQQLSNVVNQAEKFGASVAGTMRVHAGTLREKRRTDAEEKAQRAGTWILIPTVLFIFPGVFVVILGPAALTIISLFDR